MAEDIKSPVFPESVFEGTLSNWLKKEGESFKQDDVLAEIETDKVVIEVTAPSDGTINEILIEEGSTIQSSEVIGNFTKGPQPKKQKKAETEEPIKPTKTKTPKIINQEVEESSFSKGFRMGPACLLYTSPSPRD